MREQSLQPALQRPGVHRDELGSRMKPGPHRAHFLTEGELSSMQFFRRWFFVGVVQDLVYLFGGGVDEGKQTQVLVENDLQ